MKGESGMNFSLGKKWEDYVAAQVESGVFNNASEVMRDALRRQEESLLKLQKLRAEVSQGVNSIKAGKYSSASPEDIKREALQRKNAK